MVIHRNGRGSKLNRRGYAGFGPCFHLPGFQFGTGFLSHIQISLSWHRCYFDNGESEHMISSMCLKHLPKMGWERARPCPFLGSKPTQKHTPPRKYPTHFPCLAMGREPSFIFPQSAFSPCSSPTRVINIRKTRQRFCNAHQLDVPPPYFPGWFLRDLRRLSPVEPLLLSGWFQGPFS